MAVDGYFEGMASWDLSWHDIVRSEDLEKFSIGQRRSADALLFGRVRYEGMAKYWQTETGAIAEYMNALPKYVVGKTLKTADWTNTKISSSAIDEEIINMKKKLKKDIYIFGSSMLLRHLIKSGLVDEYRIEIAPHIRGSGNLLLKAGLPELDLKLVGVQQVKNDGIIITYHPVKRK
jgi:dihydrofolate reductase